MDKTGNRNFTRWMEIKERTHIAKSKRSFKTGDIWWCKIGENIGSEICGKGNDFLRPVLVIKKLSKDGFIGIPLTSKRHVGSWYVQFTFNGLVEYAVVAQVENISSYRLTYRMGAVSDPDLESVVNALMKLIAINNSQFTLGEAGNPENASK